MRTPADAFTDLYALDTCGHVQRWQSWVGLLLLPLLALIVWPLALLPLFCLAVYIETQPGDIDQFIAELAAATDLANLDTLPPSLLLYTNLTLAALIPTTWLLHKYLHQQPLATVTRVLTHPARRRLLKVGALAAVATVAVQMLLTLGYETLLAPETTTVTAADPVHYSASMLAAFALIVIFTTPLQSAAEEVVFRGYLLRTLRAVTVRSRSSSAPVRPATSTRSLAGVPGGVWVPIVLTSLLFAAAHGAQSPAVFFDRFAFGLLAAWLTVRTGGLEVAIVWHIVNNVLVFAVAGALGATAQALAPTEVGLWHMPITVAGSLTMLLILRAAGLLSAHESSVDAAPPTPRQTPDTTQPAA